MSCSPPKTYIKRSTVNVAILRSPISILIKFKLQTSKLNPQSQSFSRSYGSILPTSLTYIILLTRGCSPWRPAAVMSTTVREPFALSTRFSRINESAPDTSNTDVLYQFLNPISMQYISRVLEKNDLLKRKENSLWDFR